MEPRRVRELYSYDNLRLFEVLIDESEELKLLVERAKESKNLPFNDKLEKIKSLALQSMENAYEGMFTHPDWKRRDIMERIVLEEHPLSHVLQYKAGCCRYQGVLFFVLGFESELGSKHLLQSARVTESLHSVFNDVYDDNGILYRVNVFTESLKNKSYDYSAKNPRVYECIDTYLPGVLFYSYRKRDGKMVILEGLDTHVKS